MPGKRIFLSAGELSGDIHGGYLIRALRAERDDLEFAAIGGDNMHHAGARLIFHIRDTSFMGLTEVLKHLPFLRRMWRQTLRFIEEYRPQLVILIDYPGFNLRLARALTKRGIPVVYYICPKVWAWHQARVRQLQHYTKEVICILPFEVPWLRKRHVHATYVGNPLLDQPVFQTEYVPPRLALSKTGQPLVGLFPGSRPEEVERHIDLLVHCVDRLRADFPALQAVVAVAPEISAVQLQKRFPQIWLTWLEGSNYAIMANADVLLMASGTATLEATLVGTPYIVIYRVAFLTYLLGRVLIKVRFISLANLVAGYAGVVELIQQSATVENITRETRKILRNKSYNQSLRQFLRDIQRKMGKSGASVRAARIALQYLKD